MSHPPAGTWDLDADRSRLTFRTRALLGLLPVRGRFDAYEGSVRIGRDGKAHGELRIPAETLRTGIGRRDEHLRGTEFFDVHQHAYMTFSLNELVQKPEQTNVLTAVGSLRIKDKSVPITTRLDLVKQPDHTLRLEGEFVVDHETAGLGWRSRGMVPGTVRAKAVLVLSRREDARGSVRQAGDDQ